MLDQRPTSTQSRCRSKSQPPLGLQTRSSGLSTRKKQNARPEWDDNLTDMAALRETQEERLRRTASHVSKNIKAAQRELQEKIIRNDLEKPQSRRHCSKKGPVIREVILSFDEITIMIEESNRVLNEARTLLQEHQRTVSGKFCQ